MCVVTVCINHNKFLTLRNFSNIINILQNNFLLVSGHGDFVLSEHTSYDMAHFGKKLCNTITGNKL